MLPFCSCLPLPWVVRCGCLCVMPLLVTVLEGWAQGAVVAARPQPPWELEHGALADPHVPVPLSIALQPSPSWRSQQLIQHWISFLSVMKSYLKTSWWVSGLSTRPLPLSGCAGCIPQTPSRCRTSPRGENIFNWHDLFTGWQNVGLRAEY